MFVQLPLKCWGFWDLAPWRPHLRPSPPFLKNDVSYMPGKFQCVISNTVTSSVQAKIIDNGQKYNEKSARRSCSQTGGGASDQSRSCTFRMGLEAHWCNGQTFLVYLLPFLAINRKNLAFGHKIKQSSWLKRKAPQQILAVLPLQYTS